MKKKTVLFLSFILSVSAISLAQTKTVTNADLEKFRQKRLQNERSYRDNYERLGFPSPEALERKRIEDEQNLIEFSQQLEATRLEREALQAEFDNQSLLLQDQYLQSQNGYSNYNSGGYSYGGYTPFNYGYSNYGRLGRRPKNYGNGYNKNISSYPWIMIPGLNQRSRTLRPPFNNGNSPIKIRPGKGRN